MFLSKVLVAVWQELRWGVEGGRPIENLVHNGLDEYPGLSNGDDER